MQKMPRRKRARNKTRTTIHNLPTRVQAIVLEEAARAKIRPDLMFSARADRKTAHARFILWFRLRQMIGADGRQFSYPRIGAWFNRDHTSILYGVRRAHDLFPDRIAA